MERIPEHKNISEKLRERKTLGTPRTPIRRSLIADKSVQSKEELARRNKLVKNRIYMLQYDNQLARNENSVLQEKYNQLQLTTSNILKENERLKADRLKLNEENNMVSLDTYSLIFPFYLSMLSYKLLRFFLDKTRSSEPKSRPIQNNK